MLPTGTALAHGIYAVRAYCDGQRLDGAAYLGTRPTFDDGEAVLEVFLFDFDGDLYGRQIEVEFIGFVRADAKFALGCGPAGADGQGCRACPADAGGGAGLRPSWSLKGRRDAAPSPAAGVTVACHRHSWRHPLREHNVDAADSIR